MQSQNSKNTRLILVLLCAIGLNLSFFIAQNTQRIDSLERELDKGNKVEKQVALQRLLYEEYIKMGKGDSIIEELKGLTQVAKNNKLSLELGNIYIALGNYFLDNDSYEASLEYFSNAKKAYALIKDENRIAHANCRIGAAYLYIGEYQKSIDVNKLAINNFLETKNSSGLAISYGNMGLAYKRLGKFVLAIDCQNKSYEEEKKLNNRSGMASCLNAIGNIYFTHGDYPSALKKYFESLQIQEQAKYKPGIANALSNIGLVFKKQKDYEKALVYSLKSYEVEKQIGNKQGIGISLSNIGDIYLRKNELVKAKLEYSKALKLFIEIKDENGLADIYTSLGLLFERDKSYDSAITYHHKALDIYGKLQQLENVGGQYFNIANCYSNKKDLTKAIEFANKSLKIAYQIESMENIDLAEEALALYYEKKKDPANALLHYKNYLSYKDSIFNIDKSNALTRNEIKFEFDKKAVEDSLKNVHEQQIKDEQIKSHVLEIRQARIKNYGLYGGIFILLVFGAFIYNRFKITQNQKRIIETQKIVVEEQKHLVEEQQREIKDSINYAKRIQTSFMASEDQLKGKVHDYFIYFEPKDIVSGDFYWVEPNHEDIYICAADSTGHGIPGAFMSLLNMSLMNEALLSRKYTNTNEILDFVRKILILGLKPDETGQGGNDGMDCALIKVDVNQMQLQFSGANNPLWIIRRNELIVLKADKMPVGRSPKSDEPFSAETFKLEKGDSIYLFTDGYPDQFGGLKGKKFKYKQLQELLLSINYLELDAQKKILANTFDQWKGSLDQVDDVCVIGLKI